MKRQKPNTAKILAAVSVILKPIADREDLTSQQISSALGFTSPEEIPELVTAKHAAQMLRCTEKTLANKRVLGTSNLPFLKLAGRVFYKHRDIVKELSIKTFSSTSQR